MNGTPRDGRSRQLDAREVLLIDARPETIDPVYMPLAATTAVYEQSTMCLTSALVHHDLSDAVPFDSNIVLPRGVRH